MVLARKCKNIDYWDVGEDILIDGENFYEIIKKLIEAINDIANEYLKIQSLFVLDRQLPNT